MGKKQSFFYGGQAVIEGVMMRGQTTLAIAVRQPDGEITTKEDRLGGLTRRLRFLRWPLIRGVVALFEAMIIGIQALTWSAAQVMEDEEEELGTKELVLTMGFSLVLTVGFFVILPAYILRFVEHVVGNNVALNLIEGLIKTTLFLGYVWGISFMKDIQRVFQYHGAEHKAINCLEAGDPLTVENVRRHTKIHKRCGTSFLVFVLMTSIFLFSFFGRPPFLQRIMLHLALLPVVAGLSYELIRLAGKDSAPKFVQILSKPGMWTQLLTTREPENDQIEVAIASLQMVLASDRAAVPSIEERMVSAGTS